MEKLRFIYIKQTHRLLKSVKSLSPWKFAIQTGYDIAEAHVGELKLNTKTGAGCKFIIRLPIKSDL